MASERIERSGIEYSPLLLHDVQSSLATNQH